MRRVRYPLMSGENIRPRVALGGLRALFLCSFPCAIIFPRGTFPVWAAYPGIHTKGLKRLNAATITRYRLAVFQ